MGLTFLSKLFPMGAEWRSGRVEVSFCHQGDDITKHVFCANV